MFIRHKSYRTSKITTVPIVGYAVMQDRLNGNIVTKPLTSVGNQGDLLENNSLELISILPCAAPAVIESHEIDGHTVGVLVYNGIRYYEEGLDPEQLEYEVSTHVSPRC